MNKNKIIFIKDTLCGWCYLASDEVKKIFDFASNNDIQFDFYHKRLFVDDYIPEITSDFLEMIKHVGKEKGPKLTGLSFSDKYFDLITSKEFTHNSHLTSLGVASAKILDPTDKIAFKYAKKLQDLIFQHGMNPNSKETLIESAKGLFEINAFNNLIEDEETIIYAKKQAETANKLSIKLGAQGVPSLYYYNAQSNKYIQLNPYNLEETINIIENA